MVQVGSGKTILNGANSYSGGTTINAGTLEAANSSALGSAPVNLASAGVTFVLDNGINLNNTVYISQAAFIDVFGSDSATLSGTLVGSAPIEKDGTGTLTLNHDNRPTLSSNISYHGTLIAGVTGAFGTGTVTNFGPHLVLMDGVAISNPTNLVDGLTVTQNGGVALLAGNISQLGGPWSLIKTGGGNLLYTGASDHSGATSVTAGTLTVNGAIASSHVSVASGATLAGNGTVGTVTVSGARSRPAASAARILTVAGDSATSGSTLSPARARQPPASSRSAARSKNARHVLLADPAALRPGRQRRHRLGGLDCRPWRRDRQYRGRLVPRVRIVNVTASRCCRSPPHRWRRRTRPPTRRWSPRR